MKCCILFFFFSSRRRHTRCSRDWSSDVCSSDLGGGEPKDLFFAPIVAVQHLMAKAKTTISDYDLIEANEAFARSEEHTSELQSRLHLVCRLLLEKKKKNRGIIPTR